jgi:hypothetical protein
MCSNHFGDCLLIGLIHDRYGDSTKFRELNSAISL